VGCGEGTLRGLWQFDINAATSPSMLYDNRAELHLFFPTGSTMGHQYNGAAQNNQFYVERVTDAWDELSVTWNNQPNVTSINSILVPSSLTNPSFDDYIIDISAIALDWICNNEPNYGVELRMFNEAELYRWVSFTNREFQNINERPFLRLQYAEIEATAPSTICNGDNFSINCSLNNALDPSVYSYNWVHVESGTTYSTQNVNLPQYNSGANTYVVTVSNTWCQTAIDTVIVNVVEQPLAQITINGALILCQGDSVILSSNYPSGNLWSNGSTSSSISVLTSGDYALTVSSGGCSSESDIISVLVNPTPTAIFALPNTLCSSDIATVSYMGNASGTASYNWDFGGANVQSGNGQGPYSLSFPSNGPYTITLTVAENSCISALESNTININPTPSVLINGSQTVCEGQALEFTYNGNATVNATYAWQPGTGMLFSGSGQGPVSIEYNQSGITFIGLTVTQGGCVSDLYEMQVEVYPLPIPNIINDYSSSCDSASVNFSTSANAISYNWDFGNGSTANTQSAATTYYAGVYDVTLSLTDANGCSNSITANDLIQVYPSPIAGFISIPEIADTLDIENGTIIFNNLSVNSTLYSWDFGDGLTSSEINPEHTYNVQGSYSIQLIASNSYGCSDTALMGPIYIMPPATVFIPNTFTPNYDGLNDIFRVYSTRITNIHLQIYDRIGEKVFEIFDLNQGWDGTFRGRALNTGVYVYYCKVKYDTGLVEELFGDITLIR
jgi:gliding motility-associated-like protein